MSKIGVLKLFPSLQVTKMLEKWRISILRAFLLRGVKQKCHHCKRSNDGILYNSKQVFLELHHFRRNALRSCFDIDDE